MKMKRFCIIILASVLMAAPAGAQSVAGRGTLLTGTLLNSADGAPEMYAAVQFLAAADSSKLISYTLTSEDGSFSQSIPSHGSYILLYSAIGRKEIRIPFTLSGETSHDFGVISIEDDIEALKAASVVDQKPLVRMDVDRITYKVSDDVDAKTTTVLDMLRKVPMVSVDGQDRITVNGSSSFKVYVDGKPNQMLSANPSQVFKYMPASTVKDIEVITNPGARYDAEGAGGILNITTNTEATHGASAVADGAYGSISANASNRGVGGGVYMNAQKGRLSTGITANTITQHMDGTLINMDRVQHTPAGDVSTSNHMETGLFVPVSMVNLTADYEINKSDVISASAGYSGVGSHMDGLMTTSYSLPGTGSWTYDGTIYIKNANRSFTASADYQHSWEDSRKNLVVSYQFSSNPSINNTRNTFEGSIPGMDLSDRKADGSTNSLSHSLQTDYTSPVGQSGSFSAGVKYIYRDNSSDQTDFSWDGSAFVPSETGSLTYDFINRIGALYSEYSQQLGRLGVKAGLRYEHTWQDVSYERGQGTDFSLRYSNLVPSASLQYNLADTRNIGFAYNMRISRPGITYLNPYVDRSNPTMLSYGDTHLRTEDSHSVSLIFNSFTSKLMVSTNLRHTFTPEAISQYSFMDENQLLNSTYGNILRSNVTGLNAFVMYMPFKQTQILVNGELNYTDLRSRQLGQCRSGFSHTLLLGLQQTIPFDLRLSANIVTAGRTITLQGSSEGMSMVILGLSRSFLEDRLSASLVGIGSTSGLNIETVSTVDGPDFSSSTFTRLPLGQIKASVSWSFGTRMNTSGRKARKVNVEDLQLNSQSIGESVGNIIKSSE